MKQRTLQKTHYELFGHRFNPALEDGEEEDIHTICLQGTGRKSAVGGAKILIDQGCEHVDIFLVKGIDYAEYRPHRECYWCGTTWQGSYFLPEIAACNDCLIRLLRKWYDEWKLEEARKC